MFICHFLKNITIKTCSDPYVKLISLSLSFHVLMNRDLPLRWRGRFCQLLALEGTRATSISTQPSACRVCVGEHKLFICRVLISLSKSLFTPLLSHSIGKIRLPSASFQELFSLEKVSRRKTSSHPPLLRHL